MITSLINSDNLTEKLSEMKEKEILSQGIYIFLDSDKIYNLSDINEQFILNNVSFVYYDKKEKNTVIVNEDFKNEIGLISKLGRPFSSNRWYGSTKGIYSISSNLYSVGSLTKLSTEIETEKEENKLTNFYLKSFTGEKLKEFPSKKLNIEGMKDKDKEIKEKYLSLIESITNEEIEEFGEEFYDKVTTNCYSTLSTLLLNRFFLKNLSDYILEHFSDIPEIAKKRVNIVVGDIEPKQIEKENKIYVKYNLLANKELIFNEDTNEIQYIPDISVMVNGKKTFLKQNAREMGGKGYTYFPHTTLNKVEELYQLLKLYALTESKFITKTENMFSVYLKDNRIISKEEITSGTVRYDFNYQMTQIYYVTAQILTTTRFNNQLNISVPFKYWETLNITKNNNTEKTYRINEEVLNITSFEELKKSMFNYEKGRKSPKYLDYSYSKSGEVSKNKGIKNYSKNDSGYRFKRIEELMELIIDNKKSSSNLSTYMKDLIPISLYQTHFVGESFINSEIFYFNQLHFWKEMEKVFFNKDTLTEKKERVQKYYDRYSPIEHQIETDEEYIYLMYQAVFHIARKINKFNKENGRDSKYTSDFIEDMFKLPTTNLLKQSLNKMLFSNSKYFKEQYDKKLAEKMEDENFKPYIDSKTNRIKKEKYFPLDYLLEKLNNYESKLKSLNGITDIKYLALITEDVLYKKINK